MDRASCVHTRHDLGGRVDHYRLGRAMRKRGFDIARFLDELPDVMARTNRMLAGWIAARAGVWIECDGLLLTDRRRWICELPGGTAHMPCGGTHVRHLGEFTSMQATADVDVEAGLLTIRNETRLTPVAAS